MPRPVQPARRRGQGAFPGGAARPDARGKVFRKLFLTEASLAGKLEHPHICQIYDAAASARTGLHRDGVRRRRHAGALLRPESLLPVERIVEIAFKAHARARFAHKLGVTHRDIKPANILHTGDRPT